MLDRYVTALKNREIYAKTGNVWRIQDVPNLWRKKAEAKVIADGFYFDEDGTALPVPPNEEE